MREKLNLKDRTKVAVAALGLGVFALGGCSIGPDNELSACPKGWRTDLEVDAGVAVGVLGAIGEKASVGADTKAITPNSMTRDVKDVFTDSVSANLTGTRINSDQVDEVACETEDGKVVLNPHGAKLVAVAAMNSIELGALNAIGDKLMQEQGVGSNPVTN